MAQAQTPTNNPLRGLEFQVRDLISRGSSKNLRDAENLLRAFVSSPTATGDITNLQKELLKKREENQQRQAVQKVLQRGRRQVPSPRTAARREALAAPLQEVVQMGPPEEGVVPQAGEPGGPSLFQASPEAAQELAQGEADTMDELLDFTEQDIAELQQILPAASVKQLQEKRAEALAARNRKQVGTAEEDRLSEVARKEFEKQKGRILAKDTAPLATIGVRSNNFYDKNAAINETRLLPILRKNPNITVRAARKDAIELDDKEAGLFRGFRSAIDIIDDIEETGLKLFRTNDPASIALNAAKFFGQSKLDIGPAGLFATNQGKLFNLVKGLGSDARISDKDLEFSIDTAGLGFTQSEENFKKRIARLRRIFGNGPRRLLGLKEIPVGKGEIQVGDRHKDANTPRRSRFKVIQAQ